MLKRIMEEVVSELMMNAKVNQKEGYKEAVNDLLALLDSKVAEHEKNIEFNNEELIEKFLADKKLAGCAPGTIKNYQLELQKFKKAINKRVEDINDNDIKAYLASFKGIKNSTTSTKISILKSFFSFLLDEELIIKSPLRRIKRVKEEKNQPKYLRMDEMLQLREAVGDNLRLRSMCEFLFETGCRIGEMVALNIDDIDWESRSVKVRGKGSKERTVYFHTNTSYYLKKYLDRRLDNHPALFTTKIGEPRRVHPRSVQIEIKKLGKKAQIKKGIHPHMFRHTLATHLLNKGMEISTVSEILGHEKLSTTQIYARVTEQRKKEEYNRFIA
ncbi:hypothetical protein TS64_04095 [Aneurinibacillus migulanus]|nr:hypothetical protein TS64_04095 [Aneurinibacillus migulanus]